MGIWGVFSFLFLYIKYHIFKIDGTFFEILNFSIITHLFYLEGGGYFSRYLKKCAVFL